jgi:hypothetical protein
MFHDTVNSGFYIMVLMRIVGEYIGITRIEVVCSSLVRGATRSTSGRDTSDQLPLLQGVTVTVKG